jgi:hypothetical protein
MLHVQCSACYMSRVVSAWSKFCCLHYVLQHVLCVRIADISPMSSAAPPKSSVRPRCCIGGCAQEAFMRCPHCAYHRCHEHRSFPCGNKPARRQQRTETSKKAAIFGLFNYKGNDFLFSSSSTSITRLPTPTQEALASPLPVPT